MNTRRSFLRSVAATLVLPFLPMIESAKADQLTYRVRVNDDDLDAIKPLPWEVCGAGRIAVLRETITPSAEIYGPAHIAYEGNAVGWQVESGQAGARWLAARIILKPGWRRDIVGVQYTVDQFGNQKFWWRIIDTQNWYPHKPEAKGYMWGENPNLDDAIEFPV